MLKVGDEAPDFKLKSHLDTIVRLSQYKGSKNVVIAFYPLDWTPICSGQIPGYQEILSKFDERETQVLAISVDSVPSHKSWAYSMGGIDFPLLSDFWPHGETATKYFAFTEHGFSQRVVVVIDKQGIIRYIDYHDLNDEPDVNELFSALDQLQNIYGG